MKLKLFSRPNGEDLAFSARCEEQIKATFEFMHNRDIEDSVNLLRGAGYTIIRPPSPVKFVHRSASGCILPIARALSEAKAKRQAS